MGKIVVLNAKGGSGKTTVATNLAAYYASRGIATALFDFDPQASSTYWLSLRSPQRSQLHGIEAYRPPRAGATRAWQWRIPSDVSKVIVDTPAAVSKDAWSDFVTGASAVLVPVLPSAIDIHAATRFIQDLLIVMRARQARARVAVIGNRVVECGGAFEGLERMLASINVPFVTTLRESPCYGEAIGHGLGIHELDAPGVQQDHEQWQPLCNWLEGISPGMTGAAGLACSGDGAYSGAAPLSKVV